MANESAKISNNSSCQCLGSDRHSQYSAFPRKHAHVCVSTSDAFIYADDRREESSCT
jgi:hypothetical protein